MATRHEGPQTFVGNVTFLGSVNVPSGSFDNDDIGAAAEILASKSQQQYPFAVSQGSTSAIVARTDMVHVARGAGAAVSLEVAVDTVADSTGRTVTIDFKKSTGGGAFSSMLNAALVMASTDAAKTLKAATLGTTSAINYADGDLLEITVAVAGSTGVQALGLNVTAFVRESP